MSPLFTHEENRRALELLREALEGIDALARVTAAAAVLSVAIAERQHDARTSRDAVFAEPPRDFLPATAFEIERDRNRLLARLGELQRERDELLSNFARCKDDRDKLAEQMFDETAKRIDGENRRKALEADLERIRSERDALRRSLVYAAAALQRLDPQIVHVPEWREIVDALGADEVLADLIAKHSAGPQGPAAEPQPPGANGPRGPDRE